MSPVVKLLRVTRTLDPAAGGVVENLRQSSWALVHAGHSVQVVTLDENLPTSLDSTPFEVTCLGPSRGLFGYTGKLLPWLLRHMADFDCTVVEGLWQYQGLAVARAARRLGSGYAVMPHGMLDPWFKQAYPRKHLKKLLYWWLVERQVLHGARAVVYTCHEEWRRAQQVFAVPPALARIAALGIEACPVPEARGRAAFLAQYPELAGKRFMLFLGRIHPKKGCDNLIEAYAQTLAADADYRLVMAGPDQEGWRQALMARTEALGISGRVIWPGMIEGEVKWGALMSAECLALPSHMENFGLVVAEALSVGVPVLLSTEVQIWNEVVEDGAGLAEPDDLQGTIRLLERWRSFGEAARTQMRDAARVTFQRRYLADSAARELVSQLQGPPPAWIANA